MKEHGEQNNPRSGLTTQGDTAIFLGIDLMGAEITPRTIFDAVKDISKEIPSFRFVLFCTQAVANSIESELVPNISIEVASQVIEMDEVPLKALRTKKDTTLIKAIQALIEKRIDGLISCGNTGALIGASALLLPHLPGISKPGLLTLFPSKQAPFAVIDVGGLVTPKAENLVQFAFLGTAFQKAYRHIDKPTVAILNIGSESLKGTEELRDAWHRLKTLPTELFTFIGNIEGRDVFDGKADVVVTGGFGGNIFLKTAEGIASLVMHMVGPYLSSASLAAVQQRLSYEESFGALVTGINALVIKCHGSSSGRAVRNAIFGAKSFIEKKAMEKIAQFFFNL